MSDKFFNELKKKVLFFDKSLQLLENDNAASEVIWLNMTRGVINVLGFDFDNELCEALMEEGIDNNR